MADQLVSEFVKRTDAFAERRGISRARASTLILNDGKRLGALAAGKASITTARLERAYETLDELERGDAPSGA